MASEWQQQVSDDGLGKIRRGSYLVTARDRHLLVQTSLAT